MSNQGTINKMDPASFVNLTRHKPSDSRTSSGKSERLTWNPAESPVCDVFRQLNVLHQAASCSSCYDIRDIATHLQYEDYGPSSTKSTIFPIRLKFFRLDNWVAQSPVETGKANLASVNPILCNRVVVVGMFVPRVTLDEHVTALECDLYSTVVGPVTSTEPGATSFVDLVFAQRRKADLREDVLLTCLISSIHRYTSIMRCHRMYEWGVSFQRAFPVRENWVTAVVERRMVNWFIPQEAQRGYEFPEVDSVNGLEGHRESSQSKRTSPELRYFDQVGEKLLRTERELREKTDAILLNHFINNKRKWFMKNERYNNCYYIPATNKIRKYVQENYTEKRNLLLTAFSTYLTCTGKMVLKILSPVDQEDEREDTYSACDRVGYLAKVFSSSSSLSGSDGEGRTYGFRNANGSYNSSECEENRTRSIIPLAAKMNW
ncbi:hypothetical protein CLF_109734 [Clonorchis sinensis]|uniref:Uncharacterized protein n=1 Tax=Clonorchis sinensis TaxID=79923 RepID=G7YJQ7_CLOSI|nr:hypothetical protein CLF_109734 [Clonorchis sinensis]